MRMIFYYASNGSFSPISAKLSWRSSNLSPVLSSGNLISFPSVFWSFLPFLVRFLSSFFFSFPFFSFLSMSSSSYKMSMSVSVGTSSYD